MRKLLIAAIVLLAGVSQSQAAFEWLIDPVDGEQLEIKYKNYENLISDPAVGQSKLYGVGFVSNIFNSQDQTIWAETANAELTIVFRDFTLQNLHSDGGAVDLYFDGGVIDFFFDSTPDRVGDPLAGTNADPDPAGLFGLGDYLWLSLAGTPGVVNTDLAGGLAPAYDETQSTLHASLDLLTGFSLGKGDGLFNVTGGAMASAFDSNVGFLNNPTADAQLSSTLRDETSSVPAGSYPVRSDDPILVQFVPEPTSMAIWAAFGLGLVAFGIRRKRS